MSGRDGCSGKKRHPSKLAACIVAKRMKNCAINVYLCPRCKGWHLGRTRDPYRTAARITQVLNRHDRELQARMTPVDIDKLKELLAEATPGPWEYRPYEYDDWGYVRGPEVEMSFGPCKPIVAIAREGGNEEDYSEHRQNKTDPYAPNAAIIVALVNAAPALIAKAERVDALMDLIRRAQLNVPQYYVDWHEAARNALSPKEPE